MLSFKKKKKKRGAYKESCISIYIKQQTVLVGLNRSKSRADIFKGNLTTWNSVIYNYYNCNYCTITQIITIFFSHLSSSFPAPRHSGGSWWWQELSKEEDSPAQFSLLLPSVLQKNPYLSFVSKLKASRFSFL